MDFTLAEQIELWLKVKAKQDGNPVTQQMLLESGRLQIADLVIQLYQDIQAMHRYAQTSTLFEEFGLDQEEFDE